MAGVKHFGEDGRRDLSMRPGKKPLRKFSGLLNDPIIETVFGPDWKVVVSQKDDSQKDDSQKDIERAIEEALTRARRRQLLKLKELLSFYEIDSKAPLRWMLLSMKLACDFVPGMRVLFFDTRKRGRPAKWKSTRGTELVEAVYRVTAERRKGVADAIRVLMKRHPNEWGSCNGSDFNKKAASLQSRYYEILRQLRPHDAIPTGTKDLNEK